MSFEHIVNTLNSKITIGLEKEEIEDYFYNNLSLFFKERQFDDFKALFDYSIKLDIFLDIKKIPRRFKIISELLKECFSEMNVNYQTFLGEQINIMRFSNNFNLFEIENISKKKKKLIEDVINDEILIENLHDLFGKTSPSFIYYIKEEMPRDLYDFFVNSIGTFSDYTFTKNIEQLVHYIGKIHFNEYSTYGLSVRNLGMISDFMKRFKKSLILYKNENPRKDPKLLKYSYLNKTILVSPSNILNNTEEILSKDKYNFYSLAMVLLGGLGPQGHGFIYSTPKGEVIEICSDIRENEAIIVKYKQFIRQRFLIKLEKEMNELLISTKIIKKIITYLEGVIDKKELIDFNKKEPILQKINSFMNKTQNIREVNKNKLEKLIEKISNAITLILRKIKMEDQFKTRMKLIHEDKLKSEDIAKLTSLRDKSHYDVLRERVFFQYIVKWFYNLYYSEFKK